MIKNHIIFNESTNEFPHCVNCIKINNSENWKSTSVFKTRIYIYACLTDYNFTINNDMKVAGRFKTLAALVLSDSKTIFCNYFKIIAATGCHSSSNLNKIISYIFLMFHFKELLIDNTENKTAYFPINLNSSPIEEHCPSAVINKRQPTGPSSRLHNQLQFKWNIAKACI